MGPFGGARYRRPQVSRDDDGPGLEADLVRRPACCGHFGEFQVQGEGSGDFIRKTSGTVGEFDDLPDDVH